MCIRDSSIIIWLSNSSGANGKTTVLNFIEAGLARRVAFFYAPKILGGRDARTAVAGEGLPLAKGLQLEKIRWRNLGPDLMLTARVADAQP